MLAYSEIKNKAKEAEAYSTLYPETNSDSDSGKSNGVRLDSATAEIKNNKKAGNNGKIN